MPRKASHIPLLSDPAGDFDRKPTAEKLEFAAHMRTGPTECECILRERLRQEFKGTKHKHVSQRVILGYIVDFYFYDAKLVVEVDGGYHGETDAQQEYDAIRQGVLESAGLTVIRFTNDEVRWDLDRVIGVIRDHLPTDPIRRSKPTIAVLAEGLARAIEATHDDHSDIDYCQLCMALWAYRTVFPPAEVSRT